MRSVALMLETCGLADEAAAIDAAILKAVRERQITQDVGGTLGTREAGDFIAAVRAFVVLIRAADGVHSSR